MPKLVKEITPGGSNERSADGGQVADVSTRAWRIILNSPSEAYDIQTVIGVKIGDLHPVNTNLPCVSFSERAEGDSRVVRTVTATYRTTAGSTGEDPNKQPPDIRPARFTISSSLIESPAAKWEMVEDENGGIQGRGIVLDPLNPVGDRYDGVSRLRPLVTISIEQFDNSPTSGLFDSGCINSDEFTFLGMTILEYQCMLRSINVRPTVEAFGDRVYRGFTRTFEFVIKTDRWLVDQILEGFNIKNQGLGQADVWQDGLVLEHKDGRVQEPPNGPKTLVKPGSKVRAVVPIYCPEGGWMQRPSAQPVALNADGSPRDVENANPKVLRRKYITQSAVPFGDNFSRIGVRIQEVV